MDTLSGGRVPFVAEQIQCPQMLPHHSAEVDELSVPQIRPQIPKYFSKPSMNATVATVREVLNRTSEPPAICTVPTKKETIEVEPRELPDRTEAKPGLGGNVQTNPPSRKRPRNDNRKRI